MMSCPIHGQEFWSVNNDQCARCKWEWERRQEKADRAAAARTARVSALFERLIVSELSNPDVLVDVPVAEAWNLNAEWELAERIVDFQIEKEKNG